jgi:cytochrome c biogenesis protein CcmG/thiol:disulfide interchange protein DsbE
MRKLFLWLPLALFVGFFAVVASGLRNPPEKIIRSQMIGKPVPKFSLPPAHAGQPGLGSINFDDGRPKLLNIFASWCIPCAAEAPVLLELQRQGVDIEGIAIRDRPEDVARFLSRNGNPYARIGGDVNSSVQVSLGSSGVPESFVVDGRGIIRYQHIGDIQRSDVPVILRQLRAARQ